MPGDLAVSGDSERALELAVPGNGLLAPMEQHCSEREHEQGKYEQQFHRRTSVPLPGGDSGSPAPPHAFDGTDGQGKA